MPKLIEGARSAEAFRERRRARVKTILTILAALVLAPLTAVAGMAVPGNGYYLSGCTLSCPSSFPSKGDAPQRAKLPWWPC